MKFIVKWEEKGWIKALGLHHAFVALLGIGLGHLFGIGVFMAIFFIGWYASREWGGGVYPPATFEVMDFMAPVLVATLYMGIF